MHCVEFENFLPEVDRGWMGMPGRKRTAEEFHTFVQNLEEPLRTIALMCGCFELFPSSNGPSFLEHASPCDTVTRTGSQRLDRHSEKNTQWREIVEEN
jgi:hypothetical protein